MVGIHDEFLKGRHQPAFQPAAGVQHEVHPTQERCVECIGGLVSGLRVGQFRAAKPAAGAKRQVHPAGQLPGTVENLAGFWRSESRRARVHINGGHECAKNDRRTGLDDLTIGNTGQNFRQNLGQCPNNRHRRHRTPHDEGRYDAGLIVGGKNL